MLYHCVRAAIEIRIQQIDLIPLVDREPELIAAVDFQGGVAGHLDQTVRSLHDEIGGSQFADVFRDVFLNNDISAVWLRFLYQSGQSDAEKKAVEENVARIQNNYRHSREDCEDALALDRAQLAILKQDLRNSCIYAGMDGTVAKIKERLEGSTSVMDEEVIQIIDSTECLFEAKDLTWAAYFKEGTEVDLSIISGTGAGSYKVVPYDMENWNELMLFTLSGDTSDVNIGVGASGTLQFTVDKREQVLTVPIRAVHQAGGKSYVYVLGEGNMREVKWIETGLYGDINVEVISGLAEGEKVILK